MSEFNGIFKNLYPFRFSEPCTLDPYTLSGELAKAAFRPCGSQDIVTCGWVAPIGGECGALVHVAGGYWLICLQTEGKVLPASVIRDAVDKRVAEIEARESRRVRYKEKKTLKDEVMLDLLPSAFQRRTRLYAYIDPSGGWLVVNGSPGKAVEEFVSLLRNAAGSLPIAPLRTPRPPDITLTDWLESAPPEGWCIGHRATLREPDEHGATWVASSADLHNDDTRAHLAADQIVTRLAVEWQGRLSCVLGDDHAVRRMRFVDDALEILDDNKAETIAQEIDARFVFMALELAEFLPALVEAFGGELSMTTQGEA